jgi:PIN domain nuclease of toxin-antitoxin system
MKVLLDTQAFLYHIRSPEKLTRRAVAVLEDLDNEVFVSLASIWELQIKVSRGKLDLRKTPREHAEVEVRSGAMTFLPIELRHVDVLAALPTIHRDPFDRILVAQAKADEMTLVTGDATVRQYPVATLWQ